jgi:hypothetical protein
MFTKSHHLIIILLKVRTILCILLFAEKNLTVPDSQVRMMSYPYSTFTQIRKGKWETVPKMFYLEQSGHLIEESATTNFLYLHIRGPVSRDTLA